MNKPDFDDFAALWQQEPDVGEQARIEAFAQKARRQGKLLGYVDLGLGALIVAGFALGFVLQPGLGTASIAGVLIAATLWFNRQRRGIRQMSASLGCGDRTTFVEIAVRHARANLRRLTLTLWLFPSFVLLTVLFKLSYRSGGEIGHLVEAFAQWAVSARGIIGLTGTAAILAILIRSRRNVQSELRRLDGLGEEYRAEAHLDASGWR